MLVLPLVDLLGTHFSHLSIFRGHNNDKNCFSYCGLKQKLSQINKYVITDDGFSSGHCISRNDVDFKEDFGLSFQTKVRAIIENCFGNQGMNSWGFFTKKNSETLEIQTLGIKLIFEVVNVAIKHVAIRDEFLERLSIEKRNQESVKQYFQDIKKIIKYEVKPL